MLNSPPRRRRTPRAVAIAPFAVILATLLVGCGRDLAEPASAEQISSGQTIYDQNCARCHQASGEGYRHVYPRLQDNPLVTLHDPQPMLDILLNGRGSMPGFRGSLTLEEIALVASFIRGAWGDEARAVTPSEVR